MSLYGTTDESEPLMTGDDDQGVTSVSRGLVNRVAPDHDDEEASKANSSQRRKVAVVILLVAVAIIAGAVVLGVVLSGEAATTQLTTAVKTANVFTHLDNFYAIAQLDGKNSRSVKNNYNQSAAYVIEQLEANGVCTPWTQHFYVPVHTELQKPALALVSPTDLPYLHNVDFIGMRYGGSGVFVNVSAAFYVAQNDGCVAEDYADIPEDVDVIVGVVRGGDCDIYAKALAAQTFGAIALLQFNPITNTTLDTTRVRMADWQPDDVLITMPTFSVSWSVGENLQYLASADAEAPVLSFSFNASLTLDWTYNVICEPNVGATANVVMLGAHLDSVPEGPGLDDNASGSSTLLEIAIQYAKLGFIQSSTNPVRFAWWAAEEIGLLGARHYVHELGSDINQLALYLNYDMLGAPNFVLQVHNGLLVDPTKVPQNVSDASVNIQLAYEEYFISQDIPFVYSAMTGGSDYLPFLEAGIPSGGMATGASLPKTSLERTIFGGFANAAYDPCYHLSCDTIENISQEGITQCAAVAAYTLQKFAFLSDIKAFLAAPVAKSEL